MRKYLRSFSIHNYLVIAFLAVLVISIGLISNNVSEVRDPRPQAATSSGPKSPSAAIAVAGPKSPYSGVNNVFTSNNIRANCLFYNPLSACDYLRTTGYGFNIPANSVIHGIKVDLEAYFSQTIGDPFMILQLVKNGKEVGTSVGGNREVGLNKTTESYITIGSSTYLWGSTFTAKEINNVAFGVSVRGHNSGGSTTLVHYIDHTRITVYYTAPPPLVSKPPPTSGGGSTSTNPTSEGGTTSLPSSSSGGEVDPNIVNFLKINLSIPHLSGQLYIPVKVGSFTTTLNFTSGKSDYELDVKGAKFPLGKDLTVEVGGNKVLSKKVKVKTKAPKQPVKLGILYLGDTDMDNKIDQIDIERYFEAIVNQSENGDINGDGVVNSLDWAILLVNFGKTGSK